MPDGVVQWIDGKTGRAAIVGGGHIYGAASSDLEPVTRHVGAHVHFDIRRRAGVERAVGVRLRTGTRVSRRQHRFGTLVGARRPDTKGPAPFAHAHPERGRLLQSHPLEVARAWVLCMERSDLDGALSLYAPDAVLHAGRDHAGRAHLGAYLQTSPIFGTARDTDIRGYGDGVVVRWPRHGEAGVVFRQRIEHGLISEQWVTRAAARGAITEVRGEVSPISLTVLAHGRIGRDEAAYAVRRIAAILRRVEDRVLFARLKLDRATDPARAKPAVAQVTVDLDGDLLRARVAAHTVREAADLLQRRLTDKLEQRAQHQDHLRTRGAGYRQGSWRHGDVRAERPGYFDRPPDQRNLVRHKAFTVEELTVDEAAFDLEQLDYDFYLFRDLSSGEDAVLERLGEGKYRLRRVHASDAGMRGTSIAVDVSDTSAPQLTVWEAMHRLDSGGEPFVFFADPTTKRGNVVYRRYDGHYGLIVPFSS